MSGYSVFAWMWIASGVAMLAWYGLVALLAWGTKRLTRYPKWYIEGQLAAQRFREDNAAWMEWADRETTRLRQSSAPRLEQGKDPWLQ